jgi:hypothetical protein
MPVQIVQKFTTNISNQVIQAGEQSLLTMPSGDLLKQVEEVSTIPAIESNTETNIENSTETNEVLASL